MALFVTGCSSDACEQARREALEAHHAFAEAQETKLDAEAAWQTEWAAGRAAAGCPSPPWATALPVECRQWLKSGEPPKPDTSAYDATLRAMRIADHAVESVCVGLTPDQ